MITSSHITCICLRFPVAYYCPAAVSRPPQKKKISEKSITKCHKHLTRAKLHWPFPFRILISPVLSFCLWCFVILLWSTQLHYDCKSSNNTLNLSLLRPVLCAIATHLCYIILFYCLYHTLYMCITVSTVVES